MSVAFTVTLFHSDHRQTRTHVWKRVGFIPRSATTAPLGCFPDYSGKCCLSSDPEATSQCEVRPCLFEETTYECRPITKCSVPAVLHNVHLILICVLREKAVQAHWDRTEPLLMLLNSFDRLRRCDSYTSLESFSRQHDLIPTFFQLTCWQCTPNKLFWVRLSFTLQHGCI